MDDLMTAILAAHATALEHLAAGQETISLVLQGLTAVIKQQQTDGGKLTEEMARLNAGIERQQARIQQQVKDSAERTEAVRRTLKDLRPR